MLKRNKIVYIFLPLFALLLLNNIGRVNSYDRHAVKEENHDYQEGLGVELFMHSVGPYDNPQETYDYFSLPFCKGNWEIEDLCEHLICKKCKCCKCPEKKESNETRGGSAFEIAFHGPSLGKRSGLEMHFKVDQPKREYCNKKLTAAEADAFIHAIQLNFWYQMSIDSLPIHAFVGEMDVTASFFIYTHRRFEIGYNGPNILSVDVFAEERRQIERDLTISFTYEVRWKQSEVTFDDRSHRYLDHSFLEFRDHRPSKFGSIIVIIFLLGLTFCIINMSSTKWLAHLKIKRRGQNDSHLDLEEPYDDNWHFIRDRIFCTPAYPLIFSSLFGIGIGMIIMLLMNFAMAPFFITFPTANSTTTLLGCLTIMYFMFGGYFTGCSASVLYKFMGGNLRLQQAIFGMLLFPVICYSVIFAVNLVAIGSQVSRAVPIKQMLILMLFLSAFFFAMYAGAAILSDGRKEPNLMFKDQEQMAEVRITAPAAGPKFKFLGDGFAGPCLIALLGGFIIFSSIFADLNFIFASVWSHNVFYLFWYLLLIALIIVTVMSACVGIVATYFMLKARVYSRWCWTSFFSGASVAIYILSYAVYYYFYVSKMSGLFQSTFYIGYNLLFAIILAFFCGAMSFLASLIFMNAKFSSEEKEEG